MKMRISPDDDCPGYEIRNPGDDIIIMEDDVGDVAGATIHMTKKQIEILYKGVHHID